MPIFFIAKIFPFVKKHWKPLVGVAGVALLYFLYVTNESSWLKKLNKVESIHKDEIAAIEKARQDEQAAFREIEKKLQDDLVAAEARYSQKQEELKKVKQREVVRIITEYRDNPNGLADELSTAFGYRIVK